MSTSLGKWSIRFYAKGKPLAVETHDGGNRWNAAGNHAVLLARERRHLTCEVLNTKPTRKEIEEFHAGKNYLRWRLDLNPNPHEFTGVDDSFPRP